MGRILALDYGRRRTGVAVTDPLQIIGSALETIETHKLMDFLKKYFSENSVECVVVGLPRQMNGEMSESYTYIRPFLQRFAQEFPTMRVEMVDERFTSKLALDALIAGGARKMQRREKGIIDKVSAAIILQSYLDSRQNNLLR